MRYIARIQLPKRFEWTLNLIWSSNARKQRRFSTISDPIRDKFLQFGGGSVSLEKDNETGLALVCFDHGEKKNAFSGKMMIELSDIVTKLEKWKEGKSLLLYSPGPVFCSGADLNMVKQIDNSTEGFEMASLMHDALTRMYNLPLISAALLRGKAIGGGAELVTACDFRLMTPNSEIQFVQVKMGVSTGWGGGTRLSHLVGPSLALKLLISAQKLSYRDCEKIGLVTDLLQSDDPLNEASEWLINLTNCSPEVSRAIKKMIANSRRLSLTESLLEEKKIFASIWGGEAQKRILDKISKS